MKREMISNAMGRICDEYVAEAESYRADDRDGRILHRIAAACAAVLLVVVGVPLLIRSGIISAMIAAFQPNIGGIPENYTIEVLNVTAKTDIADYPQWWDEEYAPWSSEQRMAVDDAEAPREYTVEFDGREFRGEYKETFTAHPAAGGLRLHVYRGDMVRFYISADKNELVNFVNVFYDSELSSSVNEEMMEDATRLAEETAGKFIDTGKYELAVNNNPGECGFIYTKYVAGMKTTDETGIVIYYDGYADTLKVSCVVNTMTGAFDRVSPEAVKLLGDSEEATAAVEAKLVSLGVGKETYTVTDKCLHILDDGGIGVRYVIEAEPDDHNTVTVSLLARFGEKGADDSTNGADDSTNGKWERPEIKREPFDESDPFAVSDDNVISRAEAEAITKEMSLSEIVGMIGRPNAVDTAHHPIATYDIGDYDEHHLTVIYDLTDKVDGQLKAVSAYIEAEYKITDTDPENMLEVSAAEYLANLVHGNYYPFDAVIDIIGKPNRISAQDRGYIAEYDCAGGGVVRIKYGEARVMDLYKGCLSAYFLSEISIPNNGRSIQLDSVIKNIRPGMTNETVKSVIGYPSLVSAYNNMTQYELTNGNILTVVYDHCFYDAANGEWHYDDTLFVTYIAESSGISLGDRPDAADCRIAGDALRTEFNEKYYPVDAGAVADIELRGIINVGMTSDDVISLLGAPSKIKDSYNRTVQYKMTDNSWLQISYGYACESESGRVVLYVTSVDRRGVDSELSPGDDLANALVSVTDEDTVGRMKVGMSLSEINGIAGFPYKDFRMDGLHYVASYLPVDETGYGIITNVTFDPDLIVVSIVSTGLSVRIYDPQYAEDAAKVYHHSDGDIYFTYGG